MSSVSTTRPVRVHNETFLAAFDEIMSENKNRHAVDRPELFRLSSRPQLVRMLADVESGQILPAGYVLALSDDGETVDLRHVFGPGYGSAILSHVTEYADSVDITVTLDCFDGFLPELYARHGFVEIRREANWTPGGPDVVYMRRDPVVS